MSSRIPGEALKIMEKLENSGYEAFLVGGCVRDMLLGREPSDHDITTNALPDEVEKLFNGLPGYHTAVVGKEHGTIGVIVPEKEGSEAGTRVYEVTTYRVDGTYSDNRHPDSVTYTARIEEDLKRRDFTVNALAMNMAGEIIDCAGGMADLKAGILRAVGNPVERFDEDALRILRGIRFEAQLSGDPEVSYDFTMDPLTEAAIHERRRLLHNIAPERIQAELDKLLKAPGAVRVLRKYRDVIAEFIPELAEGFDFDQQNPFHCYDVYEHTLHAVGAVRRREDIYSESDYLKVRLAALLHDTGKPRCFVVKDGWGHFYGHEHVSEEIAQDVLERLRYDNKTREDVTALIRLHGTVFNTDEKYARHKLNQIGAELLRMLTELERADVSAQAEDVRAERIDRIDKFAEIVEKIIESDQCFSLRNLAVNGSDLIKAGFKEGPAVGRALEELLSMVMDEELDNTREALLDAASKMK